MPQMRSYHSSIFFLLPAHGVAAMRACARAQRCAIMRAPSRVSFFLFTTQAFSFFLFTVLIMYYADFLRRLERWQHSLTLPLRSMLLTQSQSRHHLH